MRKLNFILLNGLLLNTTNKGEKTMKKTYLREVKIPGRGFYNTTLDLFEGHPKSDLLYWKKHHNAHSVRYFELKEVKINV
jgi:hypothetical protein